MATSTGKFVGGLAGDTLRIYANFGSAIGINEDGTFGSLSAVGVPTGLVDAVNSQLGTSYTSYELDGNTGITSPIPDWDNYTLIS